MEVHLLVGLCQFFQLVLFSLCRFTYCSIQFTLSPHNFLFLHLDLLCTFDDSDLHLFFLNPLFRFSRLKLNRVKCTQLNVGFRSWKYLHSSTFNCFDDHQNSLHKKSFVPGDHRPCQK